MIPIFAFFQTILATTTVFAGPINKNPLLLNAISTSEKIPKVIDSPVLSPGASCDDSQKEIKSSLPQSQTPDSFRVECPKKDYPDRFNVSDDLMQVKAKISAELSGLGFVVQWKGEAGKPFSSSSKDVLRLKRLANVVVPAMKKYPASWFKVVGLKKIVLIKNLRFSASGPFRKAAPDPIHNAVYYSDNDDLVCVPGMENRIHHEFYHFIEAKLNGSTRYKDKAWMALNPVGFKYQSEGKATYSTGTDWQNFGHPHPGFISRYGELALEEDKADTFGWLMTEGYAAKLHAWTSNDPILNKKRQYLIDFLKKTSKGALNENFFNLYTFP